MTATANDVRLADLVKGTVTITRGFPTMRGIPEGEFPVLSVAALRNASPAKFYADAESVADLDVGPARPGDVLVAIEGGTVGEALVVPDGLAPFVASQQAATLRVVEPNHLDPWYLGAWLSTEPAATQLRSLARGGGIQRIPIKDLGSVMVRIPPIAEQHAIGERFRAFEEAIRSHRAVTSCLEEMRDLDLVVMFATEKVPSWRRPTPAGKKRVPKKPPPARRVKGDREG